MPPQHRANPIPQTMDTVAGYPSTLKLYQIPASKFWQARAYVCGRIVKKSTKSETKAHAIKVAKDFYNSLLLKQAQHLPLTQGSSFERVALADKRRHGKSGAKG